MVKVMAGTDSTQRVDAMEQEIVDETCSKFAAAGSHSLSCMMQHLLKYMRLVMLMPVSQTTLNTTPTPISWTRWDKVHFIYSLQGVAWRWSFFLTALAFTFKHVFNAERLVTSYMVYKSLCIFYWLWNVLVSTYFLSTRKRFVAYFAAWNHYLIKYNRDGASGRRRATKMVAIGAVFITIVFVLTYGQVTLLTMQNSEFMVCDDSEEIILAKSSLLAVSVNMARRIVGVTSNYPEWSLEYMLEIALSAGSQWIQVNVIFLPQFLYMYLCITIREEFAAVTRSLEPKGTNLRQIYQWHSAVTQLVEHTDQLLSPIIGIIYASEIILCLTSIFILAFGENFCPIQVTTAIMVSIMSMVMLIPRSIHAAKVTDMCKSVLTPLYILDVREISLGADLVEYQTFISRLQSDPVRLTAYGMFNIDRKLILTVVSVMVTYFIIMVQFQQAGNPSTTTCSLMNCNSTNITVA